MGRKIRDLSGMRFGKLFVNKLVGPKGKDMYWECTCDCGGMAEVRRDHLVSGSKTNCGCVSNCNDLSEMRFGRLVAKSIFAVSERYGAFWKCKCDCGKEKNIRSSSLVQGQTRSCGCLRKEKQYEISAAGGRISGKMNGKVKIEIARKVLREEHWVDGTSLWQCELGKDVPSNNTSGHLGVIWDKSRNLWAAQIGFKGAKIRLGRFSKLEDAVKARKVAEVKFFEPILERYLGSNSAPSNVP